MNPKEIRTVGPYRLLSELGYGGMGTVHLAIGPDRKLATVRQVHQGPLDVVKPRERFRDGIRAARAVHSPHTVAVVDADPATDVPWCACDFAFGPSLAQALDIGGALPQEAVHALAGGLTAALIDVHAAGVRPGLAPSHVLLTDSGPRVIDVGLKTLSDEPGFTSPEQALGEPLTPAADVFTLGVLLIVASTGENPFDGCGRLPTLYKIANAAPELSGVPHSLRPTIEKCLHKDPALRPTPAKLRAAFGPAVAYPSWPPPVRALIAWQRADVTRLTRWPRPAAHLPATVPSRRRGPLSLPLKQTGEIERVKFAQAVAGAVLSRRTHQPGTTRRRHLPRAKPRRFVHVGDRQDK